MSERVALRTAGIQLLDQAHIWMRCKKADQLHDAVALKEAPHLMALQLCYRPRHLTSALTDTLLREWNLQSLG